MVQAGRFPGRAAVIARLRQALAAGTLGQAYLFVGPDGSGKEVTALEFARLANCARTPPCSGGPPCESCLKALTLQHPDIRWIGPAPASLGESETGELLAAKREDPFYRPPFAASSDVTIGAPENPGPLSVRSLLRFLRLQPYQGRYKVAIVADAHRLTPEAANAFLKTLEEPPPASLILLLTSNRTALLPTILSRCQPIRFEPYGEEELAALLAELGEEPGRAADLARAADGSVRKALALREPATAALLAWAGDLTAAIHEGRSGAAQAAAELLHKGVVPTLGGGQALPVAADLAGRRERALQLCEALNVYYSEILASRERGDAWRPRHAAAAPLLRSLAARRTGPGLAVDIARIEAAKDEIDRNLNVGLTMAVLLQGLIENAEQDRAGRGP
jgi:DNA polymerase III delta prime subunit